MYHRIAIGVVGCGYWGGNYVRVFNSLPRSSVKYICEQRLAKHGELRERFPSTEVTDDLNLVLDDDEVQAVVICTEATSHYEIALRALRGQKHILVEKPIATESAAADEITKVAKQHNRVLMVGHTFLFNPSVQRLRHYIAEGAAGQIYYMYARRTNLGPIRSDVNALWDLATHDVSIFNYLLSTTPNAVSAVGAKVLRNCREDVVFLSLEYPDGVVAHIHVSWADPSKTREVVVVGSDKRILFNDLDGLEPLRIFNKGVTLIEGQATTFGEYQLQLRDGDILSPKIEASEPLKNQCSHFLACVEDGKLPISGGSEGSDVVRVLEAADESLKLQGTRVPVGRSVAYDSQYHVAAASAR